MNLSEPVNAQAVAQSVGKYRWTICALLFFATTVNYLDRQVLSLLAPSLSTEFGWSNTDYANIAAAFQFVYAISMLFAGRVVDKIGTKAAYVVAITIWSLGALMHAFSVPMGHAAVAVLGVFGVAAAPSIVGFMISRAVLAVGEAGNFPAAIKATAEYFPKKERSFATGIFNSGANVGAILAPITVPVLAAIWGWQAAFIMIGMLGFIWMSVWLWLYEKPEQQKRLSAGELAYIRSDTVAPVEKTEEASIAAAKKVSWFQLLKYRQTWAFAFGKFMTDGVWWFFLFWLPTYLSAQYGMKGEAIVLPLAVLYSMTMVGSIGGGWFPSYFMARGYAPYDGRMKAMLVIAFFPLVVLLAQPLGAISYWIPVLLIGVGASAHQAWSANIFTTVSDMFPQKSVASVIGIGGMAGGLGGVLLTKLGGWVFDYYKTINDIHTGYMIMFGICALAYLAAWVVMKALVPRHKEITDL
ncbi:MULTISPECIES: MFS transporter [Duganella]|jgi:ACS family hexuronate transporter-like MFS transporter|uniref:MFS transporter n=2 Tax=Duganella TaxID=75654 RepID=A0ABX6M645_9BURK|nr:MULTISPECIES: MFS transporter [Duganella]MYN28033.1 MFS transporter [Duganella levis]QJD89769.1 MFS transporter [Duganella dendranthematis]